jgi:hypothetical protein
MKLLHRRQIEKREYCTLQVPDAALRCAKKKMLSLSGIRTIHMLRFRNMRLLNEARVCQNKHFVASASALTDKTTGYRSENPYKKHDT